MTRTPKRPRPLRPGPRGGARDRNRRAKTESLRKAGLELFLALGLDGASIDDIVKRARMPKGSFYRYVSGKEELVGVILRPTATAVGEAFAACDEGMRAATDEAGVVGAYVELGRRLGAAILGEPKVARLYLQEKRAPVSSARRPIARLASEIESSAVALTEVALERGLLRVRDPLVSALAVVGAVEELVLATLGGHLAGRPDEVVADLVAIVLRGIRAS